MNLMKTYNYRWLYSIFDAGVYPKLFAFNWLGRQIITNRYNFSSMRSSWGESLSFSSSLLPHTSHQQKSSDKNYRKSGLDPNSQCCKSKNGSEWYNFTNSNSKRKRKWFKLRHNMFTHNLYAKCWNEWSSGWYNRKYRRKREYLRIIQINLSERFLLAI